MEPAGAGADSAPELEAGDLFMGYRIQRIAGHGAMGVVYEATQVSLDRSVALKVITPRYSHDVSYRARFQREARLAAAFDHPGVVPVHDHGEGPGGVLFLSMRFVRGQTLEDRIRGDRALSVAETLALLTPVGDALDAAHAAGLVHRDVKPGNILIETTDRGPRVFLSDFGLAKRTRVESADPTIEGQVVGTPRYMAPEQARTTGEVDESSDVYAFGCVLYRCLTGHVPFTGRDISEVLQAHLHSRPMPPSQRAPGVPPAFDGIVGRALEKDPARRPNSAGALMRRAATEVKAADTRDTLRRRAAQAPSRVPPAPARPAPVRRASGWPWVVALGLAGVAAVGTAGAVALVADDKRGTVDPQAVRALEATTAAVRATSLTGSAVRRMAESSSTSAMSANSKELDRVVRESGRLEAAGRRSRLTRRNAEWLTAALAHNADAARALRSVALTPTTSSESEISVARSEYRRALDGLESLTRQARTDLSGSGELSAANRDALGVIASDLVQARDGSTRQFDALVRQVRQLEGAE